MAFSSSDTAAPSAISARPEYHPTPYLDIVDALEKQGCKPTKRGKGFTALCPAHDDQHPSLDVDPKSDGGALTICRSAGCTFESILDALGLKGVGYQKSIATPYHVRKGVLVHAPAYLKGDDLIIPLMDIHGKQRGTQTIWPEKRTVAGKLTDKMTKGKGQADYFFVFGDPSLSDTLLVATGYATSASLHESTGTPSFMSMSDTTLPHTVRILRKKYADKEIIACLDHDARANPAILAAVTQHRALLCYPTIPGNEKADFNDLMLLSGKSAVCEVVADARLLDAPETAPEAPTSDAPAKVKESTGKPSAASESVFLRSAASIAPCAIEWLWPGWLAAGKLHLLAGSPGVSKTTIALTWAAAISSGGLFPDGSRAKQGNVLIWSSEDDPKDTLVPRLIAAGADLSRVHIVESVKDRKGKRTFDPSKDFPLLKSAVEAIGNVSFMVIDSIADAVNGDGAKNNQVRRALSPVKEFAEEMRIATLGITHFNKNVNGRVMSRIIDSVAFVGLPRVVMVAFKKRGNGSLLMRAKSNIGPDTGGYEFCTYMEPLNGYDGIVANCVCWKEFVEGSADEHLQDAESTASEPENERERAEKFLLETFADGSRRESAEVERKAKTRGLSVDSVRRARVDMKWAKPLKEKDKWYIYPPHSDDDK